MADNSNFDDEIMRKLENSSKDEAKNIIIDLIIPECRGIAKNFFTCVEEKVSTLNANNENEFNQQLNDHFIPNCMQVYNLQECVELNDRKKI